MAHALGPPVRTLRLAGSSVRSSAGTGENRSAGITRLWRTSPWCGRSVSPGHHSGVHRELCLLDGGERVGSVKGLVAGRRGSRYARASPDAATGGRRTVDWTLEVVLLTVNDIRSIEFYRDKVGFELEEIARAGW